MNVVLKSSSNPVSRHAKRGEIPHLQMPGSRTPEGNHQPLLVSLKGLSGRVGILGGTFDPVHVGHLASAQLAARAGRQDSIIFVPTAKNPLKDKSPQAGNLARLELLIAALADEPGMFVSPVQLLGEVGNYTIDLARHIKRKSPLAELTLIIGSDCLADLLKWKVIHELLEIAQFAVIERPGYPVAADLQLDGFSAREYRLILGNILRGVTVEASSTVLRWELESGGEGGGMLPPGVGTLIRERGLYRRG